MKLYHYSFLSILTLSFYFFVGFPFANYHESYGWVAQLNTNSIINFIFETVGHYSSYRPLGQTTAIFLYKIFHNSVAPIQFFNYIITAASFIILSLAINKKKSLFMVLALVTVVHIKSFTYLFHLHGLYYSAILLQISLLIYFSNATFSNKNLLIIITISVLAGLFHPFAFFISIFFIIGYYFENRVRITSSNLLTIILVIIMSVALSFLLVPNQLNYIKVLEIQSLLDIYDSLELSSIQLITSFILSLLTIRSIKSDVSLKNYLSGFILILSVIFYLASISIFIVWFISSVIKMLIQKRWVLVSLIIITFTFPLFTGFESNHLIFLILILCSFITASDYKFLEDRLSFLDKRVAAIIMILTLSLFILVKIDVRIPIISKYVILLLSAKEKTYQLEEIINWFVKSEYNDHNLIIAEEYYERKKQIDKKLKTESIPTSNLYLTAYMASLKQKNSLNKNRNVLFITFDDSYLEKDGLIYTVKGKYAGNAYVFYTSTDNK